MGKTMSVNAAYSPGMTSFEYDEEESFPENLTEEALYYGKMDHGQRFQLAKEFYQDINRGLKNKEFTIDDLIERIDKLKVMEKYQLRRLDWKRIELVMQEWFEQDDET